ncbi:MAG: hypothetical protein ABJB03_04340 [Rhodoglobus sp.]
MTAAALEMALGFTPEDLTSNRAGKLSPTQQVKMTKNRGRSQVINLVMGGIFIVFLIVIGVVVLPGLMAPQPANSSAIPAPIIIGVGAFVALIIVFTVFRSRRKITGMDGAVLSVEGVVKTRSGAFGDANQFASTGMVYRVKIGSKTFAVSTQAQVDAFDDGKTYRGYYVDSTVPILVAAEEI